MSPLSLSMFTLLNSKLPRTRPFHAQIRFCVGIFYALSPSKNITFRRLCGDKGERERRIRSFRSVWLMRWGNSPSLTIDRGRLETGVPFAEKIEEYLLESAYVLRIGKKVRSHMCSISHCLPSSCLNHRGVQFVLFFLKIQLNCDSGNGRDARELTLGFRKKRKFVTLTQFCID